MTYSRGSQSKFYRTELPTRSGSVWGPSNVSLSLRCCFHSKFLGLIKEDIKTQVTPIPSQHGSESTRPAWTRLCMVLGICNSGAATEAVHREGKEGQEHKQQNQKGQLTAWWLSIIAGRQKSGLRTLLASLTFNYFLFIFTLTKPRVQTTSKFKAQLWVALIRQGTYTNVKIWEKLNVTAE